MKKNKLIFKLDKTLDKKMAFEFLNIKQGGVDFSDGIIGVHPELECLKKTKTKDKIVEIINKHFDFFYKKHSNYLLKKTVEFNEEWSSVEDKFFKEVDEVFKNKIQTKSVYEGFISIIDCNPRFIKDNSFQVFYFHPPGVKYVASHEIMHFIFYEYAQKSLPNIFKELNTEKGIFWDLAEMFNAIILSLPEFKKIHNVENISCYPDHEKHLNYLSKLWFKNPSIDEWLIKSFNYLEKK